MAQQNIVIPVDEVDVAPPPITIPAIVIMGREREKTHIQLSQENGNFIIRFYNVHQVFNCYRVVGGDWRYTTDRLSTIFGHFSGIHYGEAEQFTAFFRNHEDQALMETFVQEGIDNCVRNQNELVAEISIRDHDIDPVLRVPGEDEGEERYPVQAANVGRAAFCGWILGDFDNRPRRDNLSYPFPTQRQITDNQWGDHFFNGLNENPRVHFRDNGHFNKNTTRYPVFEKIKYVAETDTPPSSAFIVPPFNGEYVPPRFFEDDVDNLI